MPLMMIRKNKILHPSGIQVIMIFMTTTLSYAEKIAMVYRKMSLFIYVGAFDIEPIF